MTRKLLFEPLPRSPATSRSFPHLCFLMTPRPERAFYADPRVRGRRPVGSGEGAPPPHGHGLSRSASAPRLRSPSLTSNT